MLSAVMMAAAEEVDGLGFLDLQSGADSCGFIERVKIW